MQNYFGKVVQRRSPPRFFVWNWVEWRNYNGLRQDRIRGPLLHCDERGKKAERELMESLFLSPRVPMDRWISTMTLKMQKRQCKGLHHEHTAITGCVNTTIPPQQQVRQRPNQQSEGYEESSNRLDSSGWKYYVPATMHSISVIMVATERQPVVNVETGTLHHGVNSVFFYIL